jgi:hypothetical protein
MAYRNREDHFRSEGDFIRAENRTINNSRDYPLTEEDHDRFASEDASRRADYRRHSRAEYGVGEMHSNRGRYPYLPEAKRYNQSRDWHDTYYGRGNAGQSRFEAGGGYTEDVGGSAMQNAVRSNRGRGQTDYWEPYTDNAKPFFTGAHSGQVYETDISYGGAGRAGDHLYDDHHHDPDYREWRENQLRSHDREYYAWRDAQARNYDASYGNWRKSRQERFSSDFNAWRASQTSTNQHTKEAENAENYSSGDRVAPSSSSPSMKSEMESNRPLASKLS